MRRTRRVDRRQGWLTTPLVLLALAAGPSASGGGGGAPVEDELRRYAIVALAAAEARAVVRTPQGELRLIAPGDELLDGRLEVREIRAERVVVRAGVRTLWWTASGRDDRSEVRVLDPTAPVELVRRPEPLKLPEGAGPGKLGVRAAPAAAAPKPGDEAPPPSAPEGGAI